MDEASLTTHPRAQRAAHPDGVLRRRLLAVLMTTLAGIYEGSAWPWAGVSVNRGIRS